MISALFNNNFGAYFSPGPKPAPKSSKVKSCSINPLKALKILFTVTSLTKAQYSPSNNSTNSSNYCYVSPEGNMAFAWVFDSMQPPEYVREYVEDNNHIKGYVLTPECNMEKPFEIYDQCEADTAAPYALLKISNIQISENNWINRRFTNNVCYPDSIKTLLLILGGYYAFASLGCCCIFYYTKKPSVKKYNNEGLKYVEFV